MWAIVFIGHGYSSKPNHPLEPGDRYAATQLRPCARGHPSLMRATGSMQVGLEHRHCSAPARMAATPIWADPPHW